jgi:UTP:GlnB (protein PII) uridylyltransferase
LRISVAELIIPLAQRLGFSSSDTATLALMVKQHLLTSIESRPGRDLDDPQTITLHRFSVDFPTLTRCNYFMR